MTIRKIIKQMKKTLFIKSNYSEQHKYFLTHLAQEYSNSAKPKLAKFTTICDSTNNTPENIKAGILNVDIIVN